MKEQLTPERAAFLYAETGLSACEIAGEYGLTREGVERKIRAGGVQGVHYCRIHRTMEASYSGYIPANSMGVTA